MVVITNPLGSVEGARELVGLDTEQAPDSKLSQFLTRARATVLREVSGEMQDDVLLDSNGAPAGGDGKAYFTSWFPVADRNLDGLVSVLDIDVHTWSDRLDPGSKVQLATTTYSIADFGGGPAAHGRIFINTGAFGGTTPQLLTATYRYWLWLPDSDGFSLLNDAINLMCGYKFVQSELFLIPEKYSIGGVRVSEQGILRKIETAYLEVVEAFKQRPYIGRRRRFPLFQNPLQRDSATITSTQGTFPSLDNEWPTQAPP